MTFITKFKRSALMLGMVAIIGATPTLVSSQEMNDHDRAMDVFQAMSDTLKNAESYGFTAGLFFDEMSNDGTRIKRYALYDVTVQHPNNLAWSVAFDDGSFREGVFDGTAVLFSMPNAEKYSRIPFEGTIDEFIDFLQDEHGIGLPITDFILSDIMEAQAPYILSATYLGERVLPERTLSHLYMEGTTANWQIWIENNETALPRRFVATYVRQLGDPETMITFWKWSLNQASDSDFEVNVPSSWTEILIVVED